MSYQPPFEGNWMNLHRRSTPPSVQNAVRLMYVGAGIQLIELMMSLATIGQFRRAVASASSIALTASQLHAAEVFGVGYLVIAGLIGAAVWVWMARKNNAGRRWARILASVFFGFSTLGVLVVIAEPNTGMVKILPVLNWLVGLCAIVLLWRRDSGEFFTTESRRY
jgi:hypothetical protein